MSDGTIAIGKINPQTQTTTALDGYPNVLVDDTNYLVDDTRALTGSQTTPVPDIKIRTTTNSPKSTIQRQR